MCAAASALTQGKIEENQLQTHPLAHRTTRSAGTKHKMAPHACTAKFKASPGKILCEKGQPFANYSKQE